MNKEDIIRMAREAGFVIDEKARQHQPNCIFHTHHMVDELLERFASAAYERGVADERARLRSLYESTMSPATLIDPRGSLGEPIV